MACRGLSDLLLIAVNDGPVNSDFAFRIIFANKVLFFEAGIGTYTRKRPPLQARAVVLL